MESGKVCFITGSGSGNGRGMALRFAELGYTLALHHSGRDSEGAEKTLRECEAKGVRAVLFTEDLSKSGSAERLFAQFRAEFDRLDLFVNNAGVTRFEQMETMREETFDAVCSLDQRAAFFCIREAGNYMRDTGTNGTIAVIASNHHDRVWDRASIYGSCKEALCRYVKYAALEYARYGIRVNCLAPGYINNGTVSERFQKFYAKICATEIPAHRFVKSRELADWCVFLASPAAASCTGMTIDLDGGASLVNDSLSAYRLEGSEEDYTFEP